MKWFMIVAALVISVHAAGAQDVPSPGLLDTFKKTAKDMVPALPAMPSVSLPSMPDLSMPDFSQMGDGVLREFNSFTQQVGDTLPMLEEMGYEVSTFRVQWGLPPKAKLRLRSKDATDQNKIQTIAAKASGGMLMRALVASAAEAKRIQSTMKLGTAIIDVDFALPPKVRMSFLSRKADRKDAVERDIEDLDLACGQALN
jgi:hypothetical protein